ncbi:hypothetical protein EIP91_010556, partial [Steccherinum ochraceum]
MSTVTFNFDVIVVASLRGVPGVDLHRLNKTAPYVGHATPLALTSSADGNASAAMTGQLSDTSLSFEFDVQDIVWTSRDSHEDGCERHVWRGHFPTSVLSSLRGIRPRADHPIICKLVRGQSNVDRLRTEYINYTTTLLDLQGGMAPYCYGKYTGTWDGQPVSCIFLADAGTKIQGPGSWPDLLGKLNIDQKRTILSHLKDLHGRYNLVHSQLSPKHILLKDQSVTFVDWSKLASHETYGCPTVQWVKESITPSVHYGADCHEMYAAVSGVGYLWFDYSIKAGKQQNINVPLAKLTNENQLSAEDLRFYNVTAESVLNAVTKHPFLKKKTGPQWHEEYKQRCRLTEVMRRRNNFMIKDTADMTLQVE